MNDDDDDDDDDDDGSDIEFTIKVYICIGILVKIVGGTIDRKAFVGSYSHGIVDGQPYHNSCPP